MLPEPVHVNPDYLTLTTTQLIIALEETGIPFSTATGFFYEYEEQMFLITNWHNVTGRNPINGEILSSHGGVPDMIVYFPRYDDNRGTPANVKLKLYEDDEKLQPIWLEHPEHGNQIDVVAIPLEKSDKLIYYPINGNNLETEIPPLVGDDTFVIGYPFQTPRTMGAPIWKKASIATEPNMNEDSLPKILIDTATRPGLSGSPVIYQRIGVHNLGKNGEFNDDSSIGRIRGFLGVYSGRIGKGEVKAQLGIVWKSEVIDQIISGSVRGNADFL